jgi:hypothetical protein
VASWLIEHGDLNRFGAEPLFTNPNAQSPATHRLRTQPRSAAHTPRS